MTEINVTINDYGEVYLSSYILGVRGESNARALVFDAPAYDGCQYEVWFDIGDDVPYSSQIVDNKCVVPASMLVRDTVTLQWVAVKGTELMAKSHRFEMKVLESADTVPIAPTYEQTKTILQEITEMLPTDGYEKTILVKSNSSDNTATWQDIFDYAKDVSFAQTFILDWYNEPTSEQIKKNVSVVKAYAFSPFPKNILIKSETDEKEAYTPLSGLAITGATFDMLFAGTLPGQGPNINAKRIVVDIETDEYSQYLLSSWLQFTDADKAKLASIKENADANVIEKVMVNGTQMQATNKAVNITVPTKVSELENDKTYLTWDEVQALIDIAISGLVNGDEVSY